MEQLMHVVLAWLVATQGLPEVEEMPAVDFVPPEELILMRYGNAGAGAANDVVALYDDHSQTIYLQLGWDSRDVADISALVHELVHHVQQQADLRYPCPAAREQLAYEAQAAWLAMFGSDLEAEYGLDAMSLKLGYACLPH